MSDEQQNRGPARVPEESRESGKEEKWRPRRPSPLGLMGPSESEIPKASPWPSLRAIGIMALFTAIVIGLILLGTHACR